jgi:hypothetical protein
MEVVFSDSGKGEEILCYGHCIRLCTADTVMSS